jgi:AI-2 transport protein TqsA
MSEPQDPLVDQKVRTTCLVLLTIVAVGAALILLRPVLVPLLLALLFTYCLKPLIAWQIRRLGLPRGVALGGAVLVALTILGVAGFLLALFVAELTHNLPRYQESFQELILRIQTTVPLDRVGLHVQAGQLPTVKSEDLRDILMSGISSAASVVSSGGLVLIFVLFLLLGDRGRVPRPGSLLAEIQSRAQRYILQMVGISAVTGLLVGTCLGVLGVDFAYAFGFLAFLLNFIPTVGPLVATLLPLPVVLLDNEMSLAAKVLAIVLPAAMQVTFAVIQPRIQGPAQDLHPVTTMAALVFFGSIWGILGAALAVPVTGVIKIILERIPTTRPMAEWMAGRFDPLPEQVSPRAPPAPTAKGSFISLPPQPLPRGRSASAPPPPPGAPPADP